MRLCQFRVCSDTGMARLPVYTRLSEKMQAKQDATGARKGSRYFGRLCGADNRCQTAMQSSSSS